MTIVRAGSIETTTNPTEVTFDLKRILHIGTILFVRFYEHAPGDSIRPRKKVAGKILTNMKSVHQCWTADNKAANQANH
jgi:hypothetical protein